MAVPSGATRSTLNPNAPLFIPAAFQQVEDFSPEWYDLVKTSTWFREYWFQQHQEQQTFDGSNDEDDVANLLPESFDLGVEDELSYFAELEEAAVNEAFLPVDDSTPYSDRRASPRSGMVVDDELLKSLSMKSPRGCGVRSHEPAKYWDKPVQVISPKYSPHRIIQQPR